MKTLALTHVLHSDAWGVDLPDDEHAARCAYMTSWLTQHEGDALSIVVRPSRSGEVEGTRGGHRGFDVAQNTDGAVDADQLAQLLNRALQAACEVAATDDDLHALGVEAGNAGDTATVELVRSALAGDAGARSTVTAQIIEARANALDEA